ncbi:MAG: TetR/AcrR family transcriptional regulator [Bacteroidota bacterium]
MSTDLTTEDKIKNAAREIFMKKGYAATKTRDIADAAGINLALLNYYFRSKEKLFQQIMMESLTVFFQHIQNVFNGEQTTLEEKFSLLASSYINQIREQPDIPIFILSELRARPDEFVSQMSVQTRLKDSILFDQLLEKIGKERMMEINPLHIMMNLMGLIVFPFIGRPMLERMGEVDDAHFDLMMEQRKELIPKWIMQMLE